MGRYAADGDLASAAVKAFANSARREVRAYRRSASSRSSVPRGEQLVAIAHLRVLAILNLQPGRGAPIRAVRATSPLRDDAFEVALANNAEQIATAPLQVIEVQQPALNRGHDPQQPALAGEQRQARQILAVDRQSIERIEVRPLAAEQQLVEVGAAPSSFG
jgi:hypothetical protein